MIEGVCRPRLDLEADLLRQVEVLMDAQIEVGEPGPNNEVAVSISVVARRWNFERLRIANQRYRF